MNADFTPDGYQPVTAQFHLQDSVTSRSYLWLDVFAALKVDSFRFFVRYENLATLWDSQTLFYQTARYAQPFGALRFGVGWRFLDDNRERPATGTTPATVPDGRIGPSGRGR